MRCPVCKSDELSPARLDKALPAHFCHGCGGHWVGLTDYQLWLDAQKEILPEKAPSDTPPEAISSRRIKICPHCEHLMERFRVGKGTNITLDYCNYCGGVWLDKNEWAVLKDRNLHDEMHKIFSAPWQAEVRRENTRQNFQHLYAERFGAEDYAEIRRIKAWLAEHPKRSDLMAYLNDEDPYQA